MALPTLYIDTGGHAQGSGSTDSATPTVSNTSGAAVAGTTVTLAGVDLSGVLADGSQTIYIADATDANHKIFKITAVDDALDTVTVTPAPTGTISNSAWGIGGRFVYSSTRFEGAMAAGWTAIVNNTPASKAAAFFTFRAAGNSTDGFITLKGKSGVRPKLTVTNANVCIGSTVTTNNLCQVENVELEQQGASGNVCNAIGAGCVYNNIKISDGGAIGIDIQNVNGCRIVGCEISGVGSAGIAANSLSHIGGNYIHDVVGDGIFLGAASMYDINTNIIDSAGGRGIYLSASIANPNSPVVLLGNTVYGCGASGFDVTDADANVVLRNNAFMNNGNAAGEANVKWTAGAAELCGLHSHNIFYQDAGTLATGAVNLSGLTANATELTSDPLFVDPANGDFRLQSTSPAKAAGFPGQFLGGSLGYLDLGAVQRQEASGGGAHIFGGTIAR